MNTINKQLNTILTSPNKNLKRQICLDICQSITEYGEFVVFILQNIYKMLGTDNRSLAWMIIRALRVKNVFVVIRDGDVGIKESRYKQYGSSYLKRNNLTCIKKQKNEDEFYPQTRVVLILPEQELGQIDKMLFLGATAKDYSNVNLDLATQKKEVSKIAGIDERFLKVELIEDSDISAKNNMKTQGTSKPKDFVIENVVDFFDAVMRDLTDSEWGKRHGAFGALVEIFNLDNKVDNLDYIPIEIDPVNEHFNDNTRSMEKDISNSSICEESFDEMNISPNLVIKQVTFDKSSGDTLSENNSERHKTNVENRMKQINDVNTEISVQSKRVNKQNKNDLVIKYKLPATIMNTILQVLYSDKFCDFTTDQILLPVREMAGTLLGNIFSHEFYFIDQLISFLTNNDWQIKCGCLISLNKVKEFLDDCKLNEICNVLTDLLETKDEDIIFYCAEILAELGEFLDLNRIKSICCDSFTDGNELAIGKKNIFKLLSVVFKKINLQCPIEKYQNESTIELPMNVYKYFRSPISDVRLSIIEMSLEIFPYLDLSSKNKISSCLIENVLLEDDEVLHSKSIEGLKRIIHTIPPNILLHYLKIISSELHKGYHVNDFVVNSENLLFSDSGVKLIGSEEVLKARIDFFKLILEYLYSANDDNRVSNDSVVLKEQSVSFVSHYNYESIFTDEEFKKQNKIYSVIFYNLINLYYKYTKQDFDPLKFFSSVPQGEFNKCILDKSYNSHMPSVNDNIVLYFRLRLSLDFTESNIIHLLQRETCKFFVSLIGCISYLNKSINCNLLKQIYFIVVNQDSPAMYFFEYFSITENKEFMNFLNTEENNIKFLSKLSTILKTEAKKELSTYFPKAIYSKSIPLIRFFILNDFYYTEILVNHLSTNLDTEILSNTIDIIDFSYYFLFVKPLLKRISEPLSCKVFSYIAPYLSINKIHKNVFVFKNQIKEAIKSINGLFSAYEYTLFYETSVKLRDYQKRALSWMYFLKEYGINGVLADDMGLGKTVMVLAFLSNEIYKIRNNILQGTDHNKDNIRLIDEEKYIEVNKDNLRIRNDRRTKIDFETQECRQMNYRGITTNVNKTINSKDKFIKNSGSLVQKNIKQILILTPGSLTGHWENEINTKFSYLTCEVYRKKKSTSDILIASFDQFRYDHLIFIANEYFYLIIDEGHVLRNRETLLYKRLKGIKTQHKLILTGTPVQNSVDDIFSLFNFLIPNFLGTESEFSKSYTSVIAHARDQRATERDQQKCEEALIKLRKTVGPFILRRLKSEVLKDLPPKIVTDIILEFDETEREEYEGYGQPESANYGKKGFGKIIDILKVCSHKSYIKTNTAKNKAKMSNNQSIEDNNAISDPSVSTLNLSKSGKKMGQNKNLLQDPDKLESNKKVKKDIDLSTKIKALFDIINTCGDTTMTSKIIIFTQFRSTIDFILSDIKIHKPHIKTTRIDGSTKPDLRAKIAHTFNTTDTNILLTTTATGGLGLNLTGADIVIMYEHDWNPFNDLQAMDRAHRIGQKKTVNVYRFIVKDTIEQSIMNLQNFKIFVSSKIVDSKNEEWDVGDVVGKMGGMD